MVREADGKLKSAGGLFSSLTGSSSQKYEEAIELLNRAAAMFKINKNWKEAGDTYKKMAEIYQKNFKDEQHEVSTHLSNAAKAYKNCNTSEATRCLEAAVNIHMLANRFGTAAKLWKEMGELFEKDLQTMDALHAYNKAADCFDAEDSVMNASACRLKVAQLSAEHKDYQPAIDIFERVARESLQAEKGIWSVTGYLFKALLCQFALSAASGDVSTVESTLERYKEMHPQLDNSRECKLIENLLASFTDADVDAFTDAIAQHDEIMKLDNWTAKLLLEIKQSIGGGAGGVDDITGGGGGSATSSASSSSVGSSGSSAAKSAPKRPADDHDFT